jgi:hypothetical protein
MEPIEAITNIAKFNKSAISPLRLTHMDQMPAALHRRGRSDPSHKTQEALSAILAENTPH